MRRFLITLVVLTVVLALLAPVAAAAEPLVVGVVDSESTYVNFAQQTWWAQRPVLVEAALADAGYTTVFLYDADLEDPDSLAGIDVLFLPLTRVMTEQASLTILDWVEAGGGLIGAFIGPRMLARPGCEWTADQHPRDLVDWAAPWTCTGNPDGGFEFWAREMNSAAWEWGPLSRAYQKIFINDPTPRGYSVLSDPAGAAHPIITGTLSTLGITSIAFDRPYPGAGAEFSRLYNDNVVSLLEFDIADGTGSAEGVETGQYDGYTAAQAIGFGAGRIVYYDFSVIDFLPAINATIAAQTHQGVSQGDIAHELITRSIDWAGADHADRTPYEPAARTWGEVDIYNTGIYVRQYANAIGEFPATGDLELRIYGPDGAEVFKQTRTQIGVYPGGPDLRYSMSYIAPLEWADYTVEVEYRLGYPEFRTVYLERVVVSRNQGTNIPTEPVGYVVMPDRLAGSDRYTTAVAISQSAFDPGVPVVFVATALDFPDALAGGPAAAVRGGPILLVHPRSIPAGTAAELSRLAPAEIVVLGGTSVVSAQVEAQLAGYTSGAVTRLAGGDRYGTAAAVSAATFSPGVSVAYVATGGSFPDALAAGPLAGNRGGPILLTARDALPAATRSELLRLEPAEIVVLGGTGAVSDAVLDALGSLAPSVRRVAGSDRYTTATAISTDGFAPGVPVVFLATATSFPDALAGSVVAARRNGPIVLVAPDALPAASARELDRLAPADIVILGGPGAVSDDVARAVGTYLVPAG